MFAERIKELRKEKGITQLELSQAMNLSKGTIAMWEVGKREANFATLSKLSDYFHVPIDYLLGRSNDRSDDALDKEFERTVLDVMSEEDVIDTILDFLHLDYYGKLAVRALVKSEYDRCLDTDELRHIHEHICERLLAKPKDSK